MSGWVDNLLAGRLLTIVQLPLHPLEPFVCLAHVSLAGFVQVDLGRQQMAQVFLVRLEGAWFGHTAVADDLLRFAAVVATQQITCLL
ncbi:MAG: hypothetical protein JWR37_575 [Mycobacterium sp.]|nr:hypothetical protein [Mycobacterium sp.]